MTPDSPDPSLPGAAAELEGAGPLVLLLAADPDDAWCSGTAVELARDAAARGRRVVLADVEVSAPSLHERLGMSNDEGVTDIFLYGASISRSARPVDGQGFYFISAGTYTPEPESVWSHPRWGKVVAGFRDAEAMLLAYTAVDGPAARALAGVASAAVVLGRVDPGLVPPGLPVHASFAPPPRSPDETLAFGDATLEDLPLVEPPPSRDELDLPPPSTRPERPARGGRLAFWVILIAALLAGAGYLVATMNPGLLPWGAAGEAAPGEPVAEEEPLPQPAPVATGDTLPYSVQAKAYTNLAAARAKLDEVHADLPDVTLFLSPEVVDGTLYYKLMGGAYPDHDSARELRERFARERVIDPQDAVGTWDLVRHSPLAFRLGERESREAADAAADSLFQRGVPVYPLEQPYSDGSTRWTLWAGAYRDNASAGAMGERLEEAGIAAELVARSGAPPEQAPE